MNLIPDNYFIRPRRVNDIVPLTRTDGYTYLEILEKVRAAVSDVIDYCNKFGDDVDEIVKDVNTTVDKFIKDVAANKAEYDAHIDARKNEIAALHKATEDFINDFKSKVITAHFQADATGDNATAPTADPNARISMLTSLGAHRLRDALTALVEAERVARVQAQTDAASAADTVHNALRAEIALRPTREEGARLYAPHTRDRAVFIGSSNATVNDKWTQDLCNHFGWAHHNFAIGGGGFTSSANSSFLYQTQNAISNMSEDLRRGTGYFFVADMLNDIRANNNVEAQAGTVFRLIRDNYPNARIIVVPVFLSTSPMNKSVQTAYSASARENEADRAGLPFDVEIIRGSQSWFYATPGESAATNEPGGGVHFTEAGYTQARMYIQRYIYGGDTWRNFGWENLFPYSTDKVDKNFNYTKVARFQHTVHIDGSFRVGGATAAYDTVLMNVPLWATPFESIYFTVYGRDRNPKVLYVNDKGQVACRDQLSQWEYYDVNANWRIW